MARPKKEIEVTAEEVGTYAPVPHVSEKEKIMEWLRRPDICRFERNTRWLADKIAEGEHLK